MMTETELKRELACHRLALEWAMQVIDYYSAAMAGTAKSTPQEWLDACKSAYLADAGDSLDAWLSGGDDRELDELLCDLYPDAVYERSITNGHREN